MTGTTVNNTYTYMLQVKHPTLSPSILSVGVFHAVVGVGVLMWSTLSRSGLWGVVGGLVLAVGVILCFLAQNGRDEATTESIRAATHDLYQRTGLRAFEFFPGDVASTIMSGTVKLPNKTLTFSRDKDTDSQTLGFKAIAYTQTGAPKELHINFPELTKRQWHLPDNITMTITLDDDPPSALK